MGASRAEACPTEGKKCWEARSARVFRAMSFPAFFLLLLLFFLFCFFKEGALGALGLQRSGLVFRTRLEPELTREAFFFFRCCAPESWVQELIAGISSGSHGAAETIHHLTVHPKWRESACPAAGVFFFFWKEFVFPKLGNTRSNSFRGFPSGSRAPQGRKGMSLD